MTRGDQVRLATMNFVALAALMVPPAQVASGPGRPSSTGAPVNQGLIVQQMGAMPLAFTANRGQWDDSVLFRTSAGGATVWFCRDRIYYQFIHHLSSNETDPGDPMGLRRIGHLRTGEDLSSEAGSAANEDSIEMVVVKAVFQGANPSVEVTGEDPIAYCCNYFLESVS